MAPLAFCSSPAILKAGFSLVYMLFDGLLFVLHKVAFILSVCLSARLKRTWMASPAKVAEQQKINIDLVFKTAVMVLNSNCNHYFNNNLYTLFYISSILLCKIHEKMWSSKQRFIFPPHLHITAFWVHLLLNIIKQFSICKIWCIYSYRTLNMLAGFYLYLQSFLWFSIPLHLEAELCIFLKCNLSNQGYILTHLYTQNYFRFPATFPNDSYFIGSAFAGASLKICAGLLHRLWPVINKNSPKGRAHRCYLGWPIEPQPGN